MWGRKWGGGILGIKSDWKEKEAGREGEKTNRQ